jgi:hypothetical protein
VRCATMTAACCVGLIDDACAAAAALGRPFPRCCLLLDALARADTQSVRCVVAKEWMDSVHGVVSRAMLRAAKRTRLQLSERGAYRPAVASCAAELTSFFTSCTVGGFSRSDSVQWE